MSGYVERIRRPTPGFDRRLGTNAGDPALIERLHRQLGLDRSLPEQYVVWLGNVLHGHFGYSYGQQQSP